MKHIVINGKFYSQRVTGVQRYARELVLELDKIVDPGVLELAIPTNAQNVPSLANIAISVVGGPASMFWEQVSLPLYAARRGAVTLNLCNASPLVSPGVVCLHDAKIYARASDFSRSFLTWYRLLFHNAARRAKLLLTVSEFSKSELCKYLHLKPVQVAVVPDAWQHYKRVSYDDRAIERYGLKKGNFYFSLGSLEPNKNFSWVAEVAREHPSCLFAASGAVNDRTFTEGMGFDCPSNLRLLGYVSDAEAKTLMRDCKAFLFPTFYEGFGIPPLEALSAGCRCVVVSDTEVMHELFGDAVAYVNPAEVPDIIPTKDYSELQVKQVMREYSWEKSAEKLLTSLCNL